MPCRPSVPYKERTGRRSNGLRIASTTRTRAMAEVISLDVRLHGHTIGSLTRLPNDQNIFTFDTSYVDNMERPTVSLSFKDSYGALIRNHRPTQTRLPPFFSNLLP